MSVNSTAGSEISISAGTPATFNEAGYEALTFTAVGEVTNLGEFGRENTLVTHNPIADRGTVKFKGSFNEGSMALTLGLDEDDAGQTLMQEANEALDDYSFKVETQAGNVYYFQAKVMMFKINLSGVDDVTTASTTLELTTNSGVGVVKVLA